MGRKVNYQGKVDKIKVQIEELVQSVLEQSYEDEKSNDISIDKIDWESLDDMKLLKIQLTISKILEKRIK
ncbi:hypothetical protein DWW91_11150 [Parabacteroides sp. AF17-3]|uniref:hypothetical protein n=1 Tax=Parabacteroides sp. AF17-3 TaxID=2293113 RepID=UPI000EFDE8A9|nr:hypothetical protein [Parabacteroides sp. AF17-3]RKU69546.1 hypothetical protein DWW91_11150 [Parabacteroides sp. AF17-3]